MKPYIMLHLTSLAGIVALLFPALSAHSAPIAYWKEFNAGSIGLTGWTTESSPSLLQVASLYISK